MTIETQMNKENILVCSYTCTMAEKGIKRTTKIQTEKQCKLRTTKPKPTNRYRNTTLASQKISLYRLLQDVFVETSAQECICKHQNPHTCWCVCVFMITPKDSQMNCIHPPQPKPKGHLTPQQRPRVQSIGVHHPQATEAMII